MTDAAYHIKEWLFALNDFENDVKKHKRRYDSFELSHCAVVQYDCIRNGGGAPFIEDRLYKKMRLWERLENAREIYAVELLKRYNAILRVPDAENIGRVILFRRVCLGYNIASICQELEISKECYYTHFRNAIELLAAEKLQNENAL